MKFIISFIDYIRIKWTIRKIKAKMGTISKVNEENKYDSIHR
jgi:hypothetical protein